MNWMTKMEEATELLKEALTDMESGNYDIESLQSAVAELEELIQRIQGDCKNVTFFKAD